MILRAVRLLRLALIVGWLSLMAGLAALIAMPHVAAHLDREVYIVRGSSMAPTIPLGSLIIVQHADPDEVAEGDVISFRADSGLVVTHRVVEILPGSAATLRTKGDGSLGSDPRPVATDALIGIVEAYVPVAGFVLAMLASSIGTLGVIALLGGLLLAIWFSDELLVGLTAGRAIRRGALAEHGV